MKTKPILRTNLETLRPSIAQPGQVPPKKRGALGRPAASEKGSLARQEAPQRRALPDEPRSSTMPLPRLVASRSGLSNRAPHAKPGSLASGILAPSRYSTRANAHGPRRPKCGRSERERAPTKHAPNTVLVVDDDDELRGPLLELLKLEGFDAAEVRDGREALDYLRTHQLPRLVVLDLTMPRMIGLEFLAERRRDARLTGIPVVVVSGASDARREAEALGADGWLSKPLALEAFFDTLRARCRGPSPAPRPDRLA
jgi:CheY-like chemotaxis protein